jgi:thymidine kinase
MGSRIEIILGSMYSGKSTELIRRCNRYECIGKNVLIINSSLDSRCGTNLVQTHNKQTHNALKVDKLKSIDVEVLQNVDVIGIDEAQFFDDLPLFIKYMENYNVILIVAGLDGDYKRQAFGKILECIPLADEVTKLTSMCNLCKDGTPGIFTKRLQNDNCKNVIDIGAGDKYVAVCRKHY